MPALQYAFEFYGDLPRRPKLPERLFFSLFPNVETSFEIRLFAQQFVRANRLEGTLRPSGHLHVSLHHVGDYKYLRSQFIYAAAEAGKAVSMHPFEITFRFIKSFNGAPPINGKPRRHPLVLLGEGDAVLELHEILGSAMESYRLKPARHFIPHMTLFYGPDAVPKQAIEPIRFMVNEFVLVHSRRWLTQYEVIERWPLARLNGPDDAF